MLGESANERELDDTLPQDDWLELEAEDDFVERFVADVFESTDFEVSERVYDA